MRAPERESLGSLPGTRVVAVVNGKGGVGRTTLANNLAVYARTVDSSQPVLVIGLDDASGPQQMFALDDAASQETLCEALRRGSFESAIRPGRYGVYYVPSSPRKSEVERQLADPFVLRNALQRTAFQGCVVIDTCGDFGSLTRAAVAASDFCVVPVADMDSLFTAQQVFDLLAEWGRPRSHARVVLSMLDLRIKYRAELCPDVLGLLVACTRRLGLPLFQSYVARSPKVQALSTNPEGRTYSILNEASRTSVHHQMGELADELLAALACPTVTAEGHRAGDPHPQPELSEGPVAWLRPRTPEASFAMQRAGHEPLCVSDFPFFMGRSDPAVLNDLAIEDLKPWQVSRRHAHFVRREGRIGVMDLGSSLGTWVDGQQLGGPTADPGPVFLGSRGGQLILGKRGSPYVFDVAVSRCSEQPPRAEEPEAPLRAAALAALAS